MRSIYDVIKRPVISEKSTALAEVGNRFVFEVAPAANKQEIREAVQRLFNVKVREVRTMMMHGKVKRVGRFETKRPNWKKALVTLAEGQKIDFFQTK
ncbi:MAG: 50S ribosomal protein L23 [Oligoflexia bacterium]|nr:50S ribosomal protein L23 [Oligoflexia bacterium]